mmetsp:Transcript_8807/g.36035  ORF Transcript_8807/g.36035 Transcript_8807/m.36035 type:complete len:382 (-) Transcript_8807:389-1534(-)
MDTTRRTERIKSRHSASNSRPETPPLIAFASVRISGRAPSPLRLANASRAAEIRVTSISATVAAAHTSLATAEQSSATARPDAGRLRCTTTPSRAQTSTSSSARRMASTADTRMARPTSSASELGSSLADPAPRRRCLTNTSEPNWGGGGCVTARARRFVDSASESTTLCGGRDARSADISAGSALPRFSPVGPAIPARKPAADVDAAAPSRPGSRLGKEAWLGLNPTRPKRGWPGAPRTGCSWPNTGPDLPPLPAGTHDSAIVSASLVTAIQPSAALRLGGPRSCHSPTTSPSTLAAAHAYTPAQASKGHMRSASLAAKSSQPHASSTAALPSRARCGLTRSSTVNSAPRAGSSRAGRNSSILSPLELNVGTSGDRPPGG